MLCIRFSFIFFDSDDNKKECFALCCYRVYHTIFCARPPAAAIVVLSMHKCYFKFYLVVVVARDFYMCKAREAKLH